MSKLCIDRTSGTLSSMNVYYCVVTDMEGFNSHLNMEQMNKALISLNDMYEKAAEKGEHCPNGS